MGVVGGPKIVRDGLVFGYDTGYGIANKFNSTRFYPGIPAVNCAPGMTSTSGVGTGNWTVTEITDGSITPPRKRARVFKLVAASTSNLYRQGSYYSGGGFSSNNPQNSLLLGRTSPSNFTTVGTGKYRYGFWVRGDENNPNGSISMDIGDRNVKSYTVNNNTDWYFISTDDSLGINSTSYPYDFFDIFTTTQGLTIYISDYGIYRSPGTVDNLTALQAFPFFVDYGTERSYSDSLLDLTKSTTIDVSNVSFDSDGLPTFDGTDDFISLDPDGRPTGGVGSIEAIIKPTSNNAGGIVGWGDGGTSNWGGFDTGNRTSGFSDEVLAFINLSSGAEDLVFYGRDSGGTNQLNDGNYHHVVAVVDGVENTMYLDGVKMSTISFTYGSATSTHFMEMTTLNKLRVGNSTYNNGHIPFTGEVPVVKIYDRGLTAQEIQQNFKAYKNRFNI
jgi:hypothetical protein